MKFEHPLFLILLLIPVFHWFMREYWHARDLKRLRMFVRPVLWQKVDISPPPSRLISRMLWSLGLLFCVLALAGPMWGVADEILVNSSGGENLIIALDISGSMACRDEVPDRLGRAASEIINLVDELEDVRIALVLFASHARLAVPLTLDREFFKSRLPRSPGEIRDLRSGTNIGGLIDVILGAVPEMALESRTVVLFSDGGIHDYEIENTIEKACEASLPLITVGVGGNIPVTIPETDGTVKLDQEGDTIRTVLEEETLKRISEGTGGFYTRLGTTENLAFYVREILNTNNMNRSELNEIHKGSNRRFQIPLLIAMLFFSSALILERKGK